MRGSFALECLNLVDFLNFGGQFEVEDLGIPSWTPVCLTSYFLLTLHKIHLFLSIPTTGVHFQSV